MAAILLAALLAATPPDAQAGAGAGAQALIDAMRRCSAVAAADQRLACLEKASASLEAAIDRKDVTIIDREMVRRTRRSLFGLAIPRIPFFGQDDGGKDASDDLKEITGTVRSVAEVAPDRFQIELADGATWKNIEPFRIVPKAGASVTIVRAALGSFFMDIGASKTGTRCLRLR